MITVVLVTGGRNFRDQAYVNTVMNAIRAHYGDIVVVHGGAPGLDTLVHGWAASNGVISAAVRALWGVHGKAAGPKRNAAMAALRPHVCVAFKGGPGTADMVAKTRAADIPTYEV